MNLVQDRDVLLSHPANVRVLAQKTRHHKRLQDLLPVKGWPIALGQLLEDHEDELAAAQNDSLRCFLGGWSLCDDLHARVDQFAFISPLVMLEHTNQAILCNVLNAAVKLFNLVGKK